MFIVRALLVFALSIPTSYAQGGFGDVPVTLVEVVGGKIVEKRIPRYLLDLLAPKFYRHSDGKYYDSVATTNRLLLASCTSSTREGESVRVDYPVRWLCNSTPDGDRFQGGQVRYGLTRVAAGVRADLRVRLWIAADVTAERAAVLLSKTKACLPAIQELWQRYTLSLNVQVDTNRQPVLRQWDSEAQLTDKRGRSSTHEFFFQGFGSRNEDERQNEYCLMIAHEVGHYLGLPDQYSDSACGDRKGIFDKSTRLPWLPFDVMAFAGQSFANVEVYPWDIQRVLSPLCAAALP